MLSPSARSPRSGLEHLGAPWPFRHPSPAGLKGQLPGLTHHRNPPPYTFASPCTSNSCISPLQPVLGLCPFRDKQASSPLQAMPQLSPPPPLQNRKRGGRALQQATGDTGVPKEKETLSRAIFFPLQAGPRKPVEAVQLPYSPLTYRNTSRTQDLQDRDLLLLKALGKDACWGLTPGKRPPALQAQRDPQLLQARRASTDGISNASPCGKRGSGGAPWRRAWG